MLSCWRIVQERFSKEAFTGEGARLYGGRWNSVGHAAVYAGGSRALAVLEMLVHLDGPQLLSSYLLYEAEFAESLMTELPAGGLPQDWRDDSAPGSTQAIGDAWIRSGASAVLRVPSVLIPQEHNYLLNPRHAEFGKIRISAPERFAFDSRLKG
ncbi:RES family NAD+ phosphorylase [Terracidiphilus gabretensis]|uniref:RES family NAD+ phosphorylase n=1 Tax=Terracidiphilus gabretensis TaxID=1577687 RepID=UPI00071B5F50|nr:RES family NAD+ phosphorylase [Terracidiphilus gabretensis]